MFAFSALVAGSFALSVLAANLLAPAALNAVRFLIAAVVIGALASRPALSERAILRRLGATSCWAVFFRPISF